MTPSSFSSALSHINSSPTFAQRCSVTVTKTCHLTSRSELHQGTSWLVVYHQNRTTLLMRIYIRNVSAIGAGRGGAGRGGAGQ